jgi:hypothetical protein
MSRGIDVRSAAAARAKQVEAKFWERPWRPFLGGVPESISWHGLSHGDDGAAGQLSGEQG